MNHSHACFYQHNMKIAWKIRYLYNHAEFTCDSSKVCLLIESSNVARMFIVKWHSAAKFPNSGLLDNLMNKRFVRFYEVFSWIALIQRNGVALKQIPPIRFTGWFISVPIETNIGKKRGTGQRHFTTGTGAIKQNALFERKIRLVIRIPYQITRPNPF